MLTFGDEHQQVLGEPRDPGAPLPQGDHHLTPHWWGLSTKQVRRKGWFPLVLHGSGVSPVPEPLPQSFLTGRGRSLVCRFPGPAGTNSRRLGGFRQQEHTLSVGCQKFKITVSAGLAPPREL